MRLFKLKKMEVKLENKQHPFTKNINFMNKLIIVIFFISIQITGYAQIDTVKPKLITITGAFKPKLRPVTKVDFLAQPLSVDSTKPYLSYNVPTQNLFFVYQPVPLKPLALQVDANATLQNGAYVKLGYGNFRAPFVQAGATVGDGKYSIFNAYAGYQSVKGKVNNFQEASTTYLALNGHMVTEKNIEAFGAIKFDLWNAKRFGYDTSKFIYTGKQLKHNVTHAQASFGIKNANPTEWGISYSPTISLDFTLNNYKNRELRGVLKLPVEKRFGDLVSFRATGLADVSTLTTSIRPNSFSNNLIYVLPEFIIKGNSFFVEAGIMPAWDNGVFKATPNINAEARFGENKFLFTAGWVTKYDKGNLNNWYQQNIWLNDTLTVFNTRHQEYYAGLKGTTGNHFTYSAKVGLSQMHNIPLFTNNTFDGKTFAVLRETKMKRLQIHGEVGYIVNERFNLDASANFNQFLDLETHNRAYGWLPLEVNANMHWNVLKDFNVNAGIFVFDGAYSIDYLGQLLKNKLGADLNVGVDFKITPKFNIWLQGNNILNNKYQRWNNYNVVGLQVMGGIIYNVKLKSNKIANK
jgi:hypothetical protein